LNITPLLCGHLPWKGRKIQDISEITLVRDFFPLPGGTKGGDILQVNPYQGEHKGVLSLRKIHNKKPQTRGNTRGF